MNTDHLKQKEKLITENNMLNFANDVKLNEKELKLEKMLQKELKEFNLENKTLDYNNFFEFKSFMQKSKFFDIIKSMPKGGIHHFHCTGAFNINLMNEIIYDDKVMYNIETKTFKIVTKESKLNERFLSIKSIKNTFGEKYVEDLIKNIIFKNEDLQKEEFQNLKSNIKLKFHQIKELYFYKPFFIKFLKNSIDIFIDQKYNFVEFKHIFGEIFDNSHDYLSSEEELKIYEELLKYAQEKKKDFQISVIVSVKKFLGRNHLIKNLDIYKNLKDHNLIFGFDLVLKEEDNIKLKDYLEVIMDYENKHNLKIDFIVHCGESISKRNKNIIDASLINSKRIGHGLNLSNFPETFKLIKEKNICIEVCPLSNYLLGLTPSLKNHPLKGLIFNGLQISINPNYYGFFDYLGGELDLAILITQWELNLKEIKKILLNSISYSSKRVSIDQQLSVFSEEWNKFINSYIA